MLALIPLIIYSGTSLAFWSGMISPIIILQIESDPVLGPGSKHQSDKFRLSLLAMTSFGIGEFCGSYLIGFIIDRLNSKRATIFIMLNIFLMTIITLKAINITSYGLLTFLMTFFWGLQDASINVHLFQLLGFEFENATEPFGAFLMIQGLSTFFFQIL